MNEALMRAIELQGFIEAMVPPPARALPENIDPDWSPAMLKAYRAGRARGAARCAEICAG